MPNHVANFVTIDGPDAQKMLTFMRSADNPFDFERILPCPTELMEREAPFRPQGDESEADAEKLRQRLLKRYGTDSWFDWRRERWSTKWNSYEHFEVDDYDLAFYTAWGPPNGVFCALTKRFDVTISVLCHDNGGGLCAEIEYQNGSLQKEHDLEPDEISRLEWFFEYWF